MFHLLFFFQFCWVESCSLVATNPTLSVPCEGCGHQSKSHRRKMQRRSVQRNQTVRVMWVSVVNSEITRFSVVQHVAFAVNNSKKSFLQKWIQFGLLAPTHFLKKTGIILSWQWSSQIFIAFSFWRNLLVTDCKGMYDFNQPSPEMSSQGIFAQPSEMDSSIEVNGIISFRPSAYSSREELYNSRSQTKLVYLSWCLLEKL